jgi:hypothetical protein
MSFHCGNCGTIGRKPLQVIVEARPKVYPSRFGQDSEGHTVEIDKGGEGWEIAREALACSDACADILSQASKKFFAELVESVKEGGAILRGEVKPSRRFDYDEED